MLVFIGSLTCKIRITTTQELNISRSYSVSSFQIVRCFFWHVRIVFSVRKNIRVAGLHKICSCYNCMAKVTARLLEARVLSPCTIDNQISHHV